MRSFIGAFAGAALAALVAPLTRGWFSVPTGGVGFVTVNHYPKGYDYAVIALLFAGSAIGTWVVSRRDRTPESPPVPPRRFVWLGVAVVFILMLFIHDHPYAFMDPFHEAEHLTPGFLMREGARPYNDIFILHGLAADGGLDALVFGDPPTPRRPRRLQTVLDAATLALLVPIAAEVCATGGGVLLAAVAALCAMGAGQVPVFPYFRLAPLLLAVLGLLHYVRSGSMRALMLALCASTLGLLWSLDVGIYAFGATAIATLVIRPPLKRTAILAAIAIVLPLLVLIVIRADPRQFFVDSFITIPRAISAIFSLPARKSIDWESARYYFPPIFYGWLLVTGIRNRDRRMLILAIASVLVFRTAAGRCSWSHTRFGVPLLGIALIAFVLEPLIIMRRRFAAAAVGIVLAFYLDLVPNLVAASKFLATWRSRQSHAGLVPYPFATARGIYTTPQNAADLTALNGVLVTAAPAGAPILDLSNELAVYYFFQRRPATRCINVAMLSAPPLFAEAMRQLEARPPACVIVEGLKEISQFDGLSNRERVPALFAWVDAHYPRRVRAGRFVVAMK